MSIERKKRIAGGTKNHPYLEGYGPFSCTKCDVKAKKIKTEKCSSSTMTDRGRLIKEWDETLYRCPDCGEEKTIDGYVHERDGSYSSNEERRVYGL